MGNYRCWQLITFIRPLKRFLVSKPGRMVAKLTRMEGTQGNWLWRVERMYVGRPADMGQVNLPLCPPWSRRCHHGFHRFNVIRQIRNQAPRCQGLKCWAHVVQAYKGKREGDPLRLTRINRDQESVLSHHGAILRRESPDRISCIPRVDKWPIK